MRQFLLRLLTQSKGADIADVEASALSTPPGWNGWGMRIIGSDIHRGSSVSVRSKRELAGDTTSTDPRLAAHPGKSQGAAM
jgi:hypothetical protein